MTPKQRHREAVMRQARGQCQGEGPHAGPLQAHHPIDVQRLRDARSARLIHGMGDDPLVRENLDDVVADGRNGAALCERHHGKAHAEGLELHGASKLALEAFARDYGFAQDGRGRWFAVMA